ncbi:hypothetical protein [Lactococcus garvieae]|uniref:hypothetical protein n=1 Tax=Lactococcus garvieae TaxID=1363 RepID=UPI0018D96D50|nr:hypothetical protein [Lactococcus garvieae]QPS70557.1 hypothetical protein I6G50_07285 [Lactococcus garvieae]
MKDKAGDTVRVLYAHNPDDSMSGPSYWGTYNSPSNNKGTVDSKVVTVTYVIQGYGAMIPAP